MKSHTLSDSGFFWTDLLQSPELSDRHLVFVRISLIAFDCAKLYNSWTIPYLAGVYALAGQVNPTIKPDEFWSTAMRTGKTIQIQRAGKEFRPGVILDPQALIKAIKNK